jgi:hypothetical protein
MKNTVEILRDGKSYRFDIDQAIKAGVLKEVKTFNLVLNEDELAVLQTIGGRIGGPPEGARGVFDGVYKKLLGFGPVKTDFHLEIMHESRAIYFVK